VLLALQLLWESTPPAPPVSFFRGGGGHWTVWDCGSYYEVEETGATFPGGAATLAVLFTQARNAGATIIVKIA